MFWDGLCQLFHSAIIFSLLRVDFHLVVVSFAVHLPIFKLFFGIIGLTIYSEYKFLIR